MACASARSAARHLPRVAAMAVLLYASVAIVPASAGDPPPGTVLWTVGSDGIYELGVSPDGATVYAAGGHAGQRTSDDYLTVALDASTGTRAWAHRYAGTDRSIDHLTALGVSPDGSAVFVTGTITAPTLDSEDEPSDYATVAYNAKTGAERWVQTYDGPDGRGDYSAAIDVSPDATMVFVTGTSWAKATNYDYLTLAYDATTGSEVWQKRYHGGGRPAWGDGDRAKALRVSPDGSTVFVTGESSQYGHAHYATVAYDASTGTRLWAVRPERGGSYEADALSVSPDGSAVIVTGMAEDPRPMDREWGYLTIVYDASTGARLWSDRYEHRGKGYDRARDVEVSPDGTKVFVTGSSAGTGDDEDYVTIAYDMDTGSRLWTARHSAPGDTDDDARALSVSPDGTEVFVTGSSAGSSTIAYDADTGAALWTGTFGGGDLDLSPDGSALFVTSGGGVAYTT
jgi:WD40 repeat protein